jgi:hypothetical protein
MEEGIDYYFNEDGLMVFTEAYHRKRGSCCKNKCRHCPWGYGKKKPLMPAEVKPDKGNR